MFICPMAYQSLQYSKLITPHFSYINKLTIWELDSVILNIMNTSQGFFYNCPHCRIRLSITPDLLNGKYLTCLTCNNGFKNPYYVKPSYSSARIAIGIMVFIIMITGFVSLCSSPTKSDSNVSLYYIQKNTYAATSKSAWDAWGRYSYANDLDAIQILINRGQIIALYKGEEVYLENNKFEYSIVRCKGSTQQLWVNTSHIKQKKP